MNVARSLQTTRSVLELALCLLSGTAFLMQLENEQARHEPAKNTNRPACPELTWFCRSISSVSRHGDIQSDTLVADTLRATQSRTSPQKEKIAEIIHLVVVPVSGTKSIKARHESSDF